MTTTGVGRAAEDVAAKYLKRLGYKLIDRNWRTRWCEIDLIVSKDNVIYFVEVKYRSSDKWGSGIDYITPKKMQQMRFAAEFWIARQNNSQSFYNRLAVIELVGQPAQVSEWLDDIF